MKKLYLSLLQKPRLGTFVHWLVTVFKQWPWIRPAGIIPSAAAWIDAQNESAGWYRRRRGGWHRNIYPAVLRVNGRPQSASNEFLPGPFRAEAVRTIPSAGLYYLSHAYMFSDQGAVLSLDNRIFEEFVHHFETVSLHRGPYFRPFRTFASRVEKRLEWIALLAAPEGRNHYHWLFDVLPRLHLLATMRDHIELYALPGGLSAVQLESLDLLGVTAAQVLSLSPCAKIYCERLLVPSLPGSEGSVPDWAVRFLRDSFLPKASLAGATPERIYLSRRDATTRPVCNEEHLMNILKQRGFHTVYPERLTFMEQVGLFSKAKQIVGVHGASLGNLVFSHRVKVLELFSPDYLRPDCYFTLADQCGHRYWHLVGHRPPGTTWGSVKIDPEVFQRRLDQMEKTAE